MFKEKDRDIKDFSNLPSKDIIDCALNDKESKESKLNIYDDFEKDSFYFFNQDYLWVENLSMEIITCARLLEFGMPCSIKKIDVSEAVFNYILNNMPYSGYLICSHSEYKEGEFVIHVEKS